MTKLLFKIVSFWVQIRDLYLYLFRHAIIVNAWLDDHTWRGIRHRNWGDDINYYFIKELTHRPVVSLFNFRLARRFKFKNYLCIGSLLGIPGYCNEKTIVWGAGSFGKLKGVLPKHICSVRGKLTHDILLEKGIECPDIYGDPALLLPLYYQPKDSIIQSYSLGIIPHIDDLHHSVVERIRKEHPEILVINLSRYEKWTDVIDQICSCKCILSSSLHGLIVSDAYGVPNCWVELSGKILGGYYKYQDYGSSVKRPLTHPFLINSMEDVQIGLKECQKWVKPKIETDDIMTCCPFDIIIPKYV